MQQVTIFFFFKELIEQYHKPIYQPLTSQNDQNLTKNTSLFFTTKYTKPRLTKADLYLNLPNSSYKPSTPILSSKFFGPSKTSMLNDNNSYLRRDLNHRGSQNILNKPLNVGSIAKPITYTTYRNLKNNSQSISSIRNIYDYKDNRVRVVDNKNFTSIDRISELKSFTPKDKDNSIRYEIINWKKKF